jgi:hypothetical protein
MPAPERRPTRLATTLIRLALVAVFALALVAASAWSTGGDTAASGNATGGHGPEIRAGD